MQNRSFRKKYKKHHVTRKHKLNIKKKYFKIKHKKTKNKRKRNIKNKTIKYKSKNISKKKVKQNIQSGGNFYEIPDFSYLLIPDSSVFDYIVEFSKFSGEDFIQRIYLSSIQIIQLYQDEIEKVEGDKQLSEEINTRYRDEGHRLAEFNNAIKGSLAYEFYLCFEPAIKSGELDKKTIMDSMNEWYTGVNAVKTSIKSTSPLDYEIFKGDTITEVWRNYLQFFPNTQTAYLYFCCCWKPENPPVTGIFLSIIVYLLKLPAPQPIWPNFRSEKYFYPSFIIVDLEFNKMLPWERVYITKGFENEYVYKKDRNKLSLYDVAVKYLQSGVPLNPFAFLFQEMNIWLAKTSNFQDIRNISSRRLAGKTMSEVLETLDKTQINIAILTKYYIMANGNRDIMDKYLSVDFGFWLAGQKRLRTIENQRVKTRGQQMKKEKERLRKSTFGRTRWQRPQSGGNSGYNIGIDTMRPTVEIFIKLGTFINDSDALSDSVHDSLIGRGGDYLPEDNALKAVCFSDVDDKSANDRTLEQLNATFNVLDNRGLLHGDKNIFYGDQIIDAFTSSKFFPLHEGAECYVKNVTRDLSNFIDPATTGKGDLYKCYQKLSQKLRKPDTISDKESAAYSANIVFGLCIHFVESIIRSGKPPYAGVENALKILKNIQITRIGDKGDMYFSYQSMGEFKWIASQSVMAHYIGGANGAEKRSSTEEESLFIEALKDRVDVNTLTALCRLIKYVGDKSHIVLAVTFILFKVSSLPVTILTIDRLLVKCIIQIIKGTREDSDEQFRNIGSKLSFICPAFKIFKNLTNSFNVAESVMTNQNKSKMFLACRELGPDIGLKLWFKKLADLINQYKDKLLLKRSDIGVTIIDSNVKYISDLLNDFNKENVGILTQIKEFIENPSSDLSDVPTNIIAIRDIYNEILQIIESEKEVEWNNKFQKLLKIFIQRNPPGRASLRRQPILEFMELPTINQSTSNAISNVIELFSMINEKREKVSELDPTVTSSIDAAAAGIRQYLDGRTETSKKILGFKSEDDPIVEHPSLDNLEPSMSKNSVYFNCLKNIETYLKQFKELYEVTGRLIKE